MRTDSQTSQSKGYTPKEILYYKTSLLKNIKRWEESLYQGVIHTFVGPPLNSTQTSAIDLRVYPPIPVTQPAGLDPVSLYSMILDPTQREEAVALVQRTLPLSPDISEVATLTGSEGRNPQTNESYLTFVIGNGPGWAFDIFLFTHTETGWKLLTKVLLSSQKGHEPAVRYIGGQNASALVIEHLAGYGTGIFRKAITWYRVRHNEIIPLLAYPVDAYVVGWGQAFQRHISGREIACPAGMIEGTRLEIALRVDYKADPSHEEYHEVDLFSRSVNLVLRWDEEGAQFVPTGEHSLSSDDLEGLFTQDTNGFLASNADQLIELAKNGSSLQKRWISQFLEECEQTKMMVARRAVKSALETTS